MTNQEIIQKLTQASKDLFMPSESDYPFEVVLWEGENLIQPKHLLKLAGLSESEIVEVTALNDFFRNCAFDQDWHNELQKKEVVKFQNLVKTLNSCLQDIQVFRIGKISIEVFIIGKTPNNSIAGIKTTVIET